MPALHERDGTAEEAGVCEAAAGGRAPGKAHLGVSVFICQMRMCELDSLGHPSQHDHLERDQNLFFLPTYTRSLPL